MCICVYMCVCVPACVPVVKHSADFFFFPPIGDSVRGAPAVFPQSVSFPVASGRNVFAPQSTSTQEANGTYGATPRIA